MHYFDPVTEADRAAEKYIRDRISETFPTHGILGEEYGLKEGDGMTWVIDPIDGTRAFMTGMLHWGVLLGLYDGTKPVLGVMYQPFTDELWFGDGEEAWYERDGVRSGFSVRTGVGLDEAVLTTTSPTFIDAGADRDAFHRLESRVQLCRYGGDCYQYAMLAMGFIDLVVESNLNTYDILPLIPIIRGAGGVITRWDGGDPSLGGKVVAAGDAALHRAALEVLGEAGG